MKTNVVNVVEIKALVKNIKRERPDLAEHFSEHALAEIAKDKITNYSHFVNDIGPLTALCIVSLENKLKTTHKEQKELLQNCLECDCEYPLEVIAKMTPRQKINNYLIWNGIEGFTDDILDVISAAYGIILEPDLNNRIMAFIQHENEVMNLAAEMREIAQQKPILCLESHTRLFRSALDSIMEAYSKGEYSNEDLRKEYCPDVTEVYTDWMRYKFRCSNEYEAYMLMVGDVEGNNVCNAIDAAWNWFHTGFVNNFISKDPETNLLHLNW